MNDTPQIAKLKRLFEPFLDRNKAAKITDMGTDDEKFHVIERPWDDESVLIRIPDKEAEKIAEALNPLLLPQRLSAIWPAPGLDDTRLS